jgi:outer membrane lipoprotein carrier protein
MWSLVIAFMLAGTSSPSLPTTSELVDRIQAHYDGIRDFEAAFTQRVEHRIVHKIISESGMVFFKRPGSMRWEYRSPEKLLVTDGTKSYFYVPEDRQVIVSHDREGALALAPDSPLSVIMGRTRLLEAFGVAESSSPPEVGGRVLRLIPRHPQEEFQEAEIEVRPEDGQVRRLSLLDPQGNRTDFLFESIRENVGLSDSLFEFTIPSGVDILMASENP